MTVSTKLITWFVTILLVFWSVGFAAYIFSRQELERMVILDAEILAKQQMEKIDSYIHDMYERLQVYTRDSLLKDAVLSSNRGFEKSDNILAYLNRTDEEWTSAPKEGITPFMRNIMDNSVSEHLRTIVDFYLDHDGERVFGEIFITNRYGGVVAMTGRTSDYRQDDEKWWQEAMRDGFHNGDLGYDESSGTYALDIGLRIDDTEGNSIGIIKVVLNINGVINIMRQFTPGALHKEHHSLKYFLITRDGTLINSNMEDVKFLDDLSSLIPQTGHLQHQRVRQSEEGKFVFTSNWEQDGSEIMITHVDSVGYQDFPGSGWMLVLKHNKKDIYAPLIRFRNTLTIVLLAFSLFSIVLALLLFVPVIRNIRTLRNTVKKVSSGDLNAHLSISSRDEIGRLAEDLQYMLETLRTTTVNRDKLSAEISRRALIEEEMAKLSVQYEQILNAAGQGIYGIDVNGNSTFVNRAAAQMTAWTSEELIGKNMHNFLHHSRPDGKPYPAEECPIYAVLKNGQFREISTEVFYRKDGSHFPVKYMVTPILKDDNIITGAVITFEDITRRIQTEKQLAQKAFYDPLTDLPNRTMFLTQLQHAIKSADREKTYLFAVLFLDLDRFKVINDSLGHSTGDKLLVEVARRLETCIRSVDLVSRFGGDEFALLLDGIKSIDDASFVADRIHSKLKPPFILGAQEVITTASIGIALSVTGYSTDEEVLRDADTAMYRAKDRGRARHEIFDIRMRGEALERLSFEADLRKAVVNSEFLVYYQPIVSWSKQRITGAEALIRWQHPESGLVPPLKFIPIAEDTGLILPIGEWIMRTACLQHTKWQDAGYHDLNVCVNLSPVQFHHQNLSDFIVNVLYKTGMAGRFLNVEITESIAMEKQSIPVLQSLSAMGIKVSIDDFGTGYSSLSSLHNFPVDTLKIDRSFIKNITTDRHVTEIVRAIIVMAHALKIKVVAEGVETKEHMELLKALQCDEIQGYLISKPVPADDFMKLLERGAPFLGLE